MCSSDLFELIGAKDHAESALLVQQGRADAFGMHVYYFQRTPLTPDEENRFHATYKPLDALLAESDWVCVQLPVSRETRNFLNRERLAKMKKGAVLVNVSRAALVERAALIDALKTGHLGGLILDPLYEEPGRDDDELLGLDNVILTPHLAGQPRQNGLEDFRELLHGLNKALT